MSKALINQLLSVLNSFNSGQISHEEALKITKEIKTKLTTSKDKDEK